MNGRENAEIARADHVRRGVAPYVGRASERGLHGHAAARAEQRVERQDRGPLLGRDEPVQERLPDRHRRGERHPPTRRSARSTAQKFRDDNPVNTTGDDFANPWARQQRGSTAAEQLPDTDRQETAEDLRPGDDRRDQPGDPVRLSLSPVELEQVRLQGVEDVDPRRPRRTARRASGTSPPARASRTRSSAPAIRSHLRRRAAPLAPWGEADVAHHDERRATNITDEHRRPRRTNGTPSVGDLGDVAARRPSRSASPRRRRPGPRPKTESRLPVEPGGAAGRRPARPRPLRRRT